MKARKACPAVPEETPSQTKEAGWNTQRQTSFGYGVTGLDPIVLRCALVIAVLWHTSHETNDLSHQYSYLDESRGRIAEVVCNRVNLGNTLRHNENKPKGKGSPKGEKEDNRFGEEEQDRSPYGFKKELRNAESVCCEGFFIQGVVSSSANSKYDVTSGLF